MTETLQKSIPDQYSHDRSAVMIQLDPIITEVFTDPDKNVRTAAENCAEAWSRQGAVTTPQPQLSYYKAAAFLIRSPLQADYPEALQLPQI